MYDARRKGENTSLYKYLKGKNLKTIALYQKLLSMTLSDFLRLATLTENVKSQKSFGNWIITL